MIFPFQGGEPDSKKARVGTKEELDKLTWQNLACIMTPSIVKVVEFAKRVPGFTEVCSGGNCRFNVFNPVMILNLIYICQFHSQYNSYFK